MMLRKWILISVLLATLAGCGGPYSSGDRVLVSKMAYDAGLTSPKRYEVVVFKWPRGPVDNNTPKNYIKRLLGLPGEIIAIFFGRLFHFAPEPGAAPIFDDLADGNVDPNDLWENIFMHTTDDEGRNIPAQDNRKDTFGWHKEDKKGMQARKWFQEGKFQILRKPPHIMMALRRIVYDNDYQAKDMKGKFDRWSPHDKSSWKPDKDTGFVHDGKAEASIDWIRYRHLLRPKAEVLPAPGKIEPSLIVDAMSYNMLQTTVQNKAAGLMPYWVGDLMLECNVEVAEPKGEFWLELSKGVYRFRAKWDLATGQCTLYREGLDGKLQELAKQQTSVKSAGNYMLRLANIDARLTVWVDRALPFGEGHEYEAPEMLTKEEAKANVKWDSLVSRRGPNPKNDLEPASIGSKGARVGITHVRLWRDTYYSSTVHQNRSDYSLDHSALNDPTRWEPIRKANFAAMYVQPGHYLCLGDNSQASSDSRDWGLVPERLMLGRALVVYYPLDRMGPIR